MKKHLCATCKAAVEPINIAGTKFVFLVDALVTTDAYYKALGTAAVIGRFYVATTPEAAQPGQDEPSGLCPACMTPTCCAEVGAV